MNEIVTTLLNLYHTTRAALNDGKLTAAEVKQIAREALTLALLLIGKDDSPQAKQLAAAVHQWSETDLAKGEVAHA